jgi:hypothetical protein
MGRMDGQRRRRMLTIVGWAILGTLVLGLPAAIGTLMYLGTIDFRFAWDETGPREVAFNVSADPTHPLAIAALLLGTAAGAAMGIRQARRLDADLDVAARPGGAADEPNRR